MRRPGPPALLALACLLATPAAAETCSRSTLASADFAYARWCGDPASSGTLRVARRDGRASEYAEVPVDIYRELIRTHQIQRFLATEVEGRYRRAGAATPATAARATQPARAAEAELPLPPVPPRR